MTLYEELSLHLFMRKSFLFLLILICSCSGSKNLTEDRNNHIIIKSKNTVHRSTGNGNTIFEGKNNIIQVNYDSSHYEGKNINGLTILKGDGNNIIVNQKNVTSVAENTNDTMVIIANKEKIEFNGENIIDSSKNTSGKIIIEKKSTENGARSFIAAKKDSEKLMKVDFELSKLEEDSIDFVDENAKIYLEGKEHMVTCREAFAYYMDQIKNGNVKAYYYLGTFFQMGIGTKVNSLKAEQYFEIAARKGVSEAQYTLGFIYENGFWKVEENKEKAIYYYKLAAAQGNVDAKNRLKEMNEAPAL